MSGIDVQYLTITTRARVYLLWLVLASGGFVATHFYQQHAINALWTLIAVVGLGYMLRVMPLKVRQMQHIFAAWLVPICVGMVVSGAVFYIHTPFMGQLLGHLGAFWLLVMAAGYILNGLVDRPAGWYWYAAGLNIAAAIACFTVGVLQPVQYLVAAVITAWSMANLWLFRS